MFIKDMFLRQHDLVYNAAEKGKYCFVCEALLPDSKQKIIQHLNFQNCLRNAHNGQYFDFFITDFLNLIKTTINAEAVLFGFWNGDVPRLHGFTCKLAIIGGQMKYSSEHEYDIYRHLIEIFRKGILLK